MSADPLLDTLAETCRLHPTAEKRVLLQTQAQGQILGERLAREGHPWLNLRFTTPRALAREAAAEELARLGLTLLHPAAGPALAGALLNEALGTGKPYFRRLAGSPGIARALWIALSDLRLAGLVPKDLKESAFVARDKGREMKALLEALIRELEHRKLADEARVLEVALTQAARLPKALILEDGAAVWTVLERRFLDALPGERRVLPFPAPAGLDTPRRLQNRPLVPAPGRLGRLFDPGSAAEDGNLEMFHAAGHDAEIQEVLRRILAEGIPFDQAEIACASSDPYTGLVRDAAARLDIPVTLAEGLPLAHTRPGRALAAFCRWAEEDFPREGLIRLLQSGDLDTGLDEGPGAAQTARLLNASGAAGGRTASAAALRSHARRLRARREEDDRREAEADRAERAARFVEALCALVPEGERVDPGTVFRGCRLYLERHVRPSQEEDTGALEELSRALEALEGIAPPPAPLPRILREVGELLEGLRVDRKNARPGHLHLTPLESMGWAGRPRTFVVGLDQGALPGTTRENPVLLDAELKRLSASLATGEDRASEALFLGAGRLGALAGRTTLSYTARDLRQDRELYPSSTLLQAHRLEKRNPALAYGDLLQRLDAPVTRIPADPSMALDAAGWWLASLRDAGEGFREKVLEAFPNFSAGASAPAFAPVPSAGEEADPRRSGKAVSPSALEQLARCGRQFFFRRLLRLEPSPEPRGPDRWLDPLTRGSLLHQAYADFLGGKDRDAVRLRRLGLGILEGIHETLPPPSAHVERRETEAFLDDLEYFREEEAKQQGRTPVRLEAPFGPWVLDLGPDLAFSIRGQIDRIDRIGKTHEVVDYKTGRLWPWERRQAFFEGGLQLQHALYARAAEGALGFPVSASSYLFPTREGHGHRVCRSKAEDSALRAVLEPLLALASGGLFAPTAEEKTCRHCDYRKACPAAPWKDGKALREGGAGGAPEPLSLLEAVR